MAVIGHLPCFAHPMLSAAMVRSALTTQGENLVPSTPYAAWSKAPVVCKALAFLFFLFNHSTFLFLGCAIFNPVFNGDHGPEGPPGGA